ncbi:R3H and coiled-coil domain-containing protein 1 isoform X2 [Phascolarctos cinereus]|uniref:R3H and coiled-coil domain-containing protein 1 isoform X1 n=1 Tax=Phascolarctos cinereus TaxID=38626 RepID=A0A6P5LJU3_PHACI|nr:R3H and coiled-coil domain-containing protein 1 isoform X1 [Phascolarctos cinereus]
MPPPGRGVELRPRREIWIFFRGAGRGESERGGGSEPRSDRSSEVPAADSSEFTLALLSLDGVVLSPAENDFVLHVKEELDRFLLQKQLSRVLLFPPVSSRLRYLIHRTAEKFDLLSSFSVGEGWKRRTVICHLDTRLPNLDNFSPSKPVTGRHGKSRRPWATLAQEPAPGSWAQRPVRRQCGRKPDQALYVPRALRRKSDEAPDLPLPEADVGDGHGDPIRKIPEEPKDIGSPDQDPDADPDPKLPPQAVPGVAGDLKDQNQMAPGEPKPDLDELGPPGSKSQAEEANCQEAEDQVSGNLQLSAEDSKKVFLVKFVEGKDDFGCSEEESVELIQEIMDNVVDREIQIEKIHVDSCYLIDEQMWGENGFGHVVEIYDFEPSLKTEDLMAAFLEFQEKGFKIQWVDDTHALGIFPCLASANEALTRDFPALKIRPLTQGTRQSKFKALQRPKLLHLAKERPQTSTAVARRLVAQALGLQKRCREQVRAKSPAQP